MRARPSRARGAAPSVAAASASAGAETPRQTIDDLLDDARRRIVRYEPADAYRAMLAGTLLVDTRCAELRREAGVIPGSVHAPLSVLFWRLDPASGSADPTLADPTRPVVLLCADGYSSSLAAATLRDLGFAAVGDVIGGFDAWTSAGLPVEPAARA